MTDFSSVFEMLKFIFTSLSVVLSVLILLWGVCKVNYLIARIFSKPKESKAVSKVEVAPMADLKATVAGPETRLIAILTAAANEALGQSVRVVHFDLSHTTDATWAMQGRSTNHFSHKKQA